MALHRHLLRYTSGILAVALALLFTGCAGTGAINTSGGGAAAVDRAATDRLNVGDLLGVTYSGLESNPAPHEERIKEDGTITLPFIGSVKSAGLTPGELQREIRETYIKRKFYTENLNITVTAKERYFFVGGQVRSPNRYLYAEGMTVLKAIQSAGDFNEFAKRSRVQVTRRDGQTFIVNCNKALDNPTKYDLPVYPGDQVIVPRSL